MDVSGVMGTSHLHTPKSSDLIPASLPSSCASWSRPPLPPGRSSRGAPRASAAPRGGAVSVEFADFRSYVPGDDLRYLDWNAYARLQRLFLKLFMEEEDLHVYLLLDTSRSMSFGEPSKFHWGRQAAAALSYVALCGGDRVQLFAACRRAAARPPGCSAAAGQASDLFAWLQSSRSDGGTALSAGGPRAAGHGPRARPHLPHLRSAHPGLGGSPSRASRPGAGIAASCTCSLRRSSSRPRRAT